MADLIGQSFGRYHILEQLGEGGMATVYKAYDTRLERDVAVKIIRTDQFAPAALERVLKRFEREAKALARLTHPNIVHVNDYGEYEGIPYLVMDYLPGGTLKERLGQPMPWQEAVRILLPIAQALEYAHEQGIIHRDIKPSNILITDSGQPMLSDFGIAKILSDTDATSELTGTGVGVGTPDYMAPELVTSSKIDHRADIYALGIMLYEMVTGRRPYRADTPMAVLFKHANEPLPRPKQYVPELRENVEKLLLKALAKHPDDRYQSMDELSKAMQGISEQLKKKKSRKPAQGEQEEASTHGSGKNFSHRKPLLWVIVGMVVILLITISAALGIESMKKGRLGQDPFAGLAALTDSFTSTETLTTTNNETITPTISQTPTNIPTKIPTATNTLTPTATPDNLPPYVVSSSPANGQTGVPRDLTKIIVKFNEPMRSYFDQTLYGTNGNNSHRWEDSQTLVIEVEQFVDSSSLLILSPYGGM